MNLPRSMRFLRWCSAAGILALLAGAGLGAETTAADAAGARVLHRVQRAMQAVRTFHARGTLQVRETAEAPSDVIRAELHGQGRVNGDGRFVVNVTATPDGRSFSMETRFVGGVSYARSPVTGAWYVRKTPTAASPEGVLDEALFGRLTLADLSVGRAGFLDGEPVLRIAGTAGSAQSPVRVTLWAADRDSRIHRIRLQASVPASRFASMVPGGVDQVWQSYDLRIHGFNLPVQIQAPANALEDESIDSPYGPMALYRGQRAPVRFQYPAGWQEDPANPNVTMSFVDPEDGQLAISEEPLDTAGYETGNLREYVDLVLSVARSHVDDFELLSSRRIKIGKLRAWVLTFQVESGSLTVRRLIYLHERIGVNVTYVVRTDDFERMEPLVDYSQASLELIP